VVVVTCLANVATQVGAYRIMNGNKFHYPVGNPDLPPEEETKWRADLLSNALKILQTPVEAPTVFDK
jgi:glycine reductase complex component B subunit gamma